MAGKKRVDVEVGPAAAKLAELTTRLSQVTEATLASAQAIQAQEAALVQAGASFEGAAKALGDVRAAAQGASQPRFDGLSDSMANVAQRADDVRGAHLAVKAAADAETSSLIQLKVAADSASKAQQGIAKGAAAVKASAGGLSSSFKTNEIAEGLGKLGGPLGQAGQKVLGVAEGFKKLRGSMGSGGIYTAIAVGVVAVAAGLAAVAAGLVAATGKIAFWGVMNTDAKRVNETLGKFEKNIKKTFSFDTKTIDRLVKGLDSLSGLFEENSITGQAMQVVFRDIFGGITDAATGFIPKIRTAFIQLQIYILKALIAIKPFGSTIVTVGKILAVMAAIVVGSILVVLGLLAVNLAALAFGFGVVVTAVTALIAGFISLTLTITNALAGAFKSIFDYFANTSLEQMGLDLIGGLVRGITGAAGAVVSAVTGAVGGAITAAKSALGIASPSKVFAEIGMNTAAGMAQGVEGEASAVQGSLESLVTPPVGGAATPAAAPSSSSESTGGGSGGADFSGAVFNFYGVEGAEGAVSKFREMLTLAIEGDVAQLSAAVAA